MSTVHVPRTNQSLTLPAPTPRAVILQQTTVVRTKTLKRLILSQRLGNDTGTFGISGARTFQVKSRQTGQVAARLSSKPSSIGNLLETERPSCGATWGKSTGIAATQASDTSHHNSVAATRRHRITGIRTCDST